MSLSSHEILLTEGCIQVRSSSLCGLVRISGRERQLKRA